MILDNISLEGIGIAELKRSISNWDKVSDIIYGNVSEHDLLIMMKI